MQRKQFNIFPLFPSPLKKRASPSLSRDSFILHRMRLLGVGARDPRILKARKWLEDHGGCLGVPSWGKFWLAVLGVFDWSGCHCLFPEMVLLPKWFPIHTARMWSYCRTVYMPMSYIYGVKFSCDTDDLIRELREEMIFEPVLPSPQTTLFFSSRGFALLHASVRGPRIVH